MPQEKLLSLPMLLIAAVLFMGALVPNLFVLAPRFLAQNGYDEQQIGIVMGGFNIAVLAITLVAGRITELLGHRLVAVGGCVVAGVGCILFDAAGSTAGYVVARAIQGAGFAAVLVTAASYVAEIAPPGRLAQALGISGVLTLASQAVGPFFGELLEGLAGWHWVFVSGAVGGGIGALIALFLPRADRSETAVTPGSLSAFPILLAIGFAGFGFGSVWTFLADYTDRVGVGEVTPFFAPYVLAAIATRIFFGHLADRLGRRTVAVPALLVHALALLLLSQLASLWQLVATGSLFGLAHGFYYPALQAMVVERSPVSAARAIAAATFAFGFGITASAFGLGALAKALSYSPIYLVAAGAGVVAAGIVATRR